MNVPAVEVRSGVPSEAELDKWVGEFLNSDAYRCPGRKPSGRSARTLDRPVADRRKAARGRSCVANAVLSAPGAEGLSMPQETPVWVSVWDHGSGWGTGYDGARVRIQFGLDDPGEWVPRQWVKEIPK